MMTPDADPDPEIETDLTDLQTADCPSCCGTRRVSDMSAGSCTPCPRCVPRARSARGSSPTAADLQRDLELALESSLDDVGLVTLRVDEISGWLGRLLTRPATGDGHAVGDDGRRTATSAGEVEFVSTNWDGEGLVVHAVGWRDIGFTRMRCGEQVATPCVESSSGPETCRACSSVLLSDRAASERVTQRVIRVAPAQIWAIVEPEIESVTSLDDAPRLSPIASLALLASEYLVAERAFRRAEVSAMSLASALTRDQALERVARAEVALRQAVSSARPADPVVVPPLGYLAQHSWLAGPVDSIAQRPVRFARWRRFRIWARAAVGRLRRGWEPG